MIFTTSNVKWGMITVILSDSVTKQPLWIDLCEPTNEEIDKIAVEYGLPLSFIADCHGTGQLPKFERLGTTTLIIVRSFDEAAQPTETSVREVTRKLGLILGDRFLITFHRHQQIFLTNFFSQATESKGPVYLQKILLELLLAAVETFHAPIEDSEAVIHQFEERLTEDDLSVDLKRLLVTKSRLLVLKRMLWHTLNATQKYVPSSDINRPLSLDLTERITNQMAFADGLVDSINNALNIRLSLSAYETNRVIRILTLFSAIFMPLTFIVGIYGMNFDFMPELHHPYGYAGVWMLMVSTTTAIFLWFKSNRWIK